MLRHGSLPWMVLLLSLVPVLALLGLSSAQTFRLEPRCTGLDADSEHELVAFDGKNCVSFFGFASCNYNCGDTGVHLPSSLGAASRRPLRLVMRAARSLQLEPACLSWVEVQSSARVVTISNKLTSRKCRYWLRVIDSQVIGLDVGINDLTIMNSDVGYINLPSLLELAIYNSSIASIDHIVLDMYPGSIECSYIKNVFFMNITAEKFNIRETAIETIGPGSILFNGKTLNITNAYIRNLNTRGITMLSGELNIVNTVIEYVAENAIVTEDATVSMTNVTIVKMDRPGFSFQLENDVNLSNVIVAGQPLTLPSRLVTLKAQKIQVGPVNTDDEVFITGWSDSNCTQQDGQLHCNYEGVQKTVTFDQNALPPQYPISVTATKDLAAEGDFSCSAVTLLSVQGRYISTRNPTCPWAGELNAMNSSLVTVVGQLMQALTLNSSTVSKMQSVSVKQLTLVNSVIGDIYAVSVTEHAHWEKSTVKQITSLDLQSLTVDDCYIDEILKMNLDQDTNGSSIISNTVINKLSPRGSIKILSGRLELHSVTIVTAHSGSIYVDPNGSLLLRNVTFLTEIYGLVVASTRDQVSIESSSGVTRPTSTLVNVRSEFVAVDKTIPADAESVGSDSPYCDEVTHRFLRCDYSFLQKSEVLISSSVPVVSVSNVFSVWIEPTNSQIISLAEVSEVHVVPSSTNPRALFHLECINTTIVSLTSSIKALTLTSSSVTELFLIPGNPLIYLLARTNSEINSLAVEADKCEIEHGTIGNVHYLKSRTFLLRESSIVNVNENSISITEEVNIIDSHIDYIEKHGITSLGDINLRNVSISFAENCSIVVQKHGTLAIQNVIIKQGDVTNFFCVIGSVSYVSNVTLGGITFETLDDFNSYFGHHFKDDSNKFVVTSWDDLARQQSDGGVVGYSSDNKNSKQIFTPIFWVGISVGSMVSMVMIITGLLGFQGIQRRRRLSQATSHVEWRGSSDTVTCGNDDVTEPLFDNASSHDGNEVTIDEANLDMATERTRLVGHEV